MSESLTCRLCGELRLPWHTCAPLWYVRADDDDDARQYHAHTAEEAAEKHALYLYAGESTRDREVDMQVRQITDLEWTIYAVVFELVLNASAYKPRGREPIPVGDEDP